jgi:hypothetical protein
MGLIDDSKAPEYIGKTVLLGITYLDHDKKLIEQKQWIGTISKFSQKEGIKIDLKNSDKPYCLPPDERGIRTAPPGVYRLHSTGEEIVNPDYLATWICTKPDPKKKGAEPDGPPDVSPRGL